MHPEQIKAEIRMAGTTQAVIAEQLNVTPATISQVIHGHGESARIQEYISRIIGKPVDVSVFDSNRQKIK